MESLAGRLLLPWLRFTLRPAEVGEQLKTTPAPVCYVLGQHSGVDAMMVRRACASANLPRAGRKLLPRASCRRYGRYRGKSDFGVYA
jgi:glycerol-3-phosphate O-acyltransferase